MRHDVSWVMPLLGKPWVSAGRGPDQYDCWGLLRAIHADQFGIDLPEYAGVDAANVALANSLLSAAAQGDDWAELSRPIHGCVVAMGHNGRISHVGVYLQVDGGLVLHCQRGAGVVLHSMPDIAGMLRYSTVQFFQYVGQSQSGECNGVSMEIQ